MKRRQSEKFSVFQASGGIYSTRKIPPWHMGQNEVLQYLDYTQQSNDEEDNTEDWTLQRHSA